MKTSKQNEIGKEHLAGGLTLAAALAGALLGWPAGAAIVAVDSATPGAVVIRGTDSSGAPSSLSSGVSDVLKMVQAKVDPEVIKTYVKNSPTAYNPSAAEIISLKERGVSDDIVTAMVQRGGELRAQATRAGQAAPAPAAPPAGPYAPAPASDYGTAPYYPDYGYDYGGYPYGYPYAYPVYSYPYYSYWPSYWPFFFGFGFGHGFHHHFHHHHFDHFAHHFHDGFNHFGSGFGVHRPGTFGMQSGAFRTGFTGRTAPVAGRTAGMMSAGFRSGGFSGRAAPFAGRPGGMMSAGFRSGGFGAHAAPMGGMRSGGFGGMRAGGGHAMGRGR